MSHHTAQNICKKGRKMNLPNRRPCITTEVGEGLSVTVSYHPETNEAVEIFVPGRGKKASDGPMTDALYNLGVQASKLMQKEDLHLGTIDVSAAE